MNEQARLQETFFELYVRAWRRTGAGAWRWPYGYRAYGWLVAGVGPLGVTVRIDRRESINPTPQNAAAVAR